MENIPKPNFNSNSDNNQETIKKIHSEDNSIITNNISEDKKEKENKETKPNNNNEISNNLNENIFINKSKDNLLNFKTSYPLLFK